jgi:hypothetical protein
MGVFPPRNLCTQKDMINSLMLHLGSPVRFCSYGPFLYPISPLQIRAARKCQSPTHIMSTTDKALDMESVRPTKSNSSNTKGSINVQIDGETYSIDAGAERRLVWKFDLRVLPILSVSWVRRSISEADQC